MHTLKQIGIQRLFIVLFIISFFAPPVIAKSVYAITNHDSSTVKAYRIDDDQIEEQTTAENLPGHVEGAVGLAINPDSASQTWTMMEMTISMTYMVMISALTLI